MADRHYGSVADFDLREKVAGCYLEQVVFHRERIVSHEPSLGVLHASAARVSRVRRDL
jgi:hypothetical protein